MGGLSVRVQSKQRIKQSNRASSPESEQPGGKLLEKSCVRSTCCGPSCYLNGEMISSYRRQQEADCILQGSSREVFDDFPFSFFAPLTSSNIFQTIQQPDHLGDRGKPVLHCQSPCSPS